MALPDIQVEFEARTPEPADFGGIKRFLFKLFNNSCKIDYSGEARVCHRQIVLDMHAYFQFIAIIGLNIIDQTVS